MNKRSSAFWMAEAAYAGIFAEEVGRIVVEQIGIKLMVFDPEHEEIVRWIPLP